MQWSEGVYEWEQRLFGNLTWNLPNIPAPEFLTIIESKEAEDNEDCQRSHDGCRVQGLPWLRSGGTTAPAPGVADTLITEIGNLGQDINQTCALSKI